MDVSASKISQGLVRICSLLQDVIGRETSRKYNKLVIQVISYN